MTKLNEEQTIVANTLQDKFITVYNRIPYSLLSSELSASEISNSTLLAEIQQIHKYYEQFEKGVSFSAEGSNGDYVAANLRYKMSSNLIKKEARFLFGELPDITPVINTSGQKVTKEIKDAQSIATQLIQTVINKSHFASKLIKGAKDCFIGKRVALLINFNEVDGITLNFLPSTDFVYEVDGNDIARLSKFVAFEVIQEHLQLSQRRILKKKYTSEYDEENERRVVYLEEAIYDGNGTLIEELTEPTIIELEHIPAVVITNDGLTGDIYGVSEMAELKNYEQWYNKIANSDIDSGRKAMHQIKYTVDMNSVSTSNLSTGPGAYWDLQSEDTKVNSHPSVGSISADTSYSPAVSTTLERIEKSAYDGLDIPNIDPKSMSGIITSGKAMKILYWPLIQRANEKMKDWGPALAYIFEVLLEGAKKYPHIITRYIQSPLPEYVYEVEVVNNVPLPEDVETEKNMDMSEVIGQTMSRKSYMMKWRQLTDQEAQEELQQIAQEQAMFNQDVFDTPDVESLENEELS